MSEGNGSGPSVVGVDGSASSKRALRWAARQAELTEAVLRAVLAWQLPSGYGMPADFSDTDFAGQARRVLEDSTAEALGGHPGVEVVLKVVQGHPAPVLVEEAEGADLLVVGSHGRGAFTGMLLGSVSGHCVHHAPCPVLVVREPRS
ncbi:universal stress protein [Kitasatospora phosalacinea]|uniref:Universal stress protein n=1 Tax=Kitasatospora phosalacinea TaxID=2065 RepID=A0A9W6UM68_9ACTN|nr:universal stress protein [Kitasatospora phosalacinea]GLW55136.1 universal stress protein [Kitasatospora phosalacinea]